MIAATVIWPITDLIAAHDVGQIVGPHRATQLQTAREAVRTQLLTLAAGVFVAGALWFTAQNFRLSRQGQVTDRYTKAIEQTGSEKLDVRIGAIYALERIARDSASDHPTVMEVLAAFIREHSHEPWPPPPATDAPGSNGIGSTTRADVQAALTVIGRRNRQRDKGSIDLRAANLIERNLVKAELADADLQRADLTRAMLINADLTNAHLFGANLGGAILTGADLTVANLTGAILTGADLTYANLTRAHGASEILSAADGTLGVFAAADLTDANLTEANLGGAFLANADLTGANLTRAKLNGAYLRDANLSRADLGDADLTGANLTGANLTGAKLTLTYHTLANPDVTILAGADLTEADLAEADLTEADLTGANLTGANLTGANLTGATFSEDQPVPEGWLRDPDSGRLRRADSTAGNS